MIKIKSISPLIATILLVVVAVALIAILLSWGKDFATDSLDQTNTLEKFSESDTGMYIKVNKITNGRFLVSYNPPSTFSKDPIIITHYSFLNTSKIPLDNKVTINPFSQKAIDLGIIEKEFDLVLYLENGTKITKLGLENKNINPLENCPEGYSFVVGNWLYDTVKGYSTKGGFCVAKYEMKADSNSDGIGDSINWEYNAYSGDYFLDNDIVSTPQGRPIAEINVLKAREACETINGHLINNNERMTIARNIERVPENWTSGIVGEGSLKMGNNGGECTFSSACYDGDDPEYGVSRNELASLSLNNGDEIWDFSGNLREFIDDNITNHPTPINNWIEFSELEGYGQFSYNTLNSFDPSLNSDNGVGKIRPYDSLKTIAMYGGNYATALITGVFTLDLTAQDTSDTSDIGFRCVLD